MGIKIQLNSLEAVEKLLAGDDGTVTLEVKNSIVQQFANTHLKAVANEGIMVIAKKALDIELQNISKQVSNALIESVRDGWYNKNQLTGEAKLLVASNAKFYVDKLISDYFEQTLAEIKDKFEFAIDNANKDIETKINHIANEIESKISEAIFTKKIDELVDAKIKERLGLK